MDRRIYQILDVRVCLETDDSRLAERFDLDYRYFRVPSRSRLRNWQADLRVRASLSESPPRVELDSVVHLLDGHPHPLSHALTLIIGEVFARVRSFVLIHAAVAVKDNRAVIISGDGGIGKTTLLLHLLERPGFTFFSDDVCPIERSTGRVFAFPRTAWIREGGSGQTLDSWPTKRPVGLPGILQGQRLAPCRAGSVFILAADPHEEEVVRVLLKKPSNPELVTALSLAGASVSTEQRTPCLTIQYPARTESGVAVRRVLDAHASEIWSFARIPDGSPDFTREPEIRRLGASALAFHLVGQLKQDLFRPKAALRPGGLMFELMDLLAAANGYLIRTGRLESVAKLVNGVC